MIGKIKQAILRKSVLSILITAVILGVLVLGSLPTQAVSLEISGLDGVNLCVGQCYYFYVEGYLQAGEEIPVDRVRLDFNGPTPAFFECDFNYGNVTQSGQFTVTPLPNYAPGYGYGYGYGYSHLYGYGYGYQEAISPTGYGYFSHDWGYGYGYSWGYGYQLPQQLRARVRFCAINVTPGDYTAQLSIWTGPGAKRFLSPVYHFTIMTCGGGPGGGSPGDTTPPIITNCGCCPRTSPTDTTAEICWTTNELSDSRVTYRGSPWMFSPLDPALVIEHHVTLTGLTPGTTYHYKTMSRDAAGNLRISPEMTFDTKGSTPETTPPETTPPETTPTTSTEEAPAAESAVNWGLIIGIIAVVVVIGLIMYFLGRSLRRSV